MDDYSDNELLEIMECAQKPPSKQPESEDEEEQDFNDQFNFLIPDTPRQMPNPKETSTPKRPPIPLEPTITVIKKKPSPPDENETIELMNTTPQPQPPHPPLQHQQ